MGPEGLTPCLYQTAHETVLWPVRIADVRYATRDMAALGIPAAAGAQAALHIRLETPQDLPFSQVKLEALTFHIQATGEKQMRLYEQMVGGCQGVIVRPPGARPGASCALGPDAIRPVGLGRQEALLPYDARSFQGYRLLHEYFAFPQRFMFVQIGGLGQAVCQCAGGQLDIILLMKEADLHLDSAVEAADLALFCTPSINLFPKQADWIPVTDRFSEFQVIPDRTRCLDYEVYRVMRVAGQSSAQKEQEFLPFYAANDFQRESGAGGAYEGLAEHIDRGRNTAAVECRGQ
jgi:type VI secretion system protein ImpG